MEPTIQSSTHLPPQVSRSLESLNTFPDRALGGRRERLDDFDFIALVDDVANACAEVFLGSSCEGPSSSA